MDSFKLGTRKGVELLGTVLTIGSMAGQIIAPISIVAETQSESRRIQVHLPERKGTNLGPSPLSRGGRCAVDCRLTR